MNGNHIPTPLQDKQYGMSQKAANLPLQPIGISNNANDPTNGSSFQDVSKAIQKNNSAKQSTGAGFDFTEADNFAGIDTNDCLNNGQSLPIAKRFATYQVFPQLGLEKTASPYGLRKIFN